MSGSAPEANRRVAELYRAHAAALRSTLNRLAGPGIEPDDLLQEVFVVALRRSEALVAGPSERAWLYGVAVKVAQAARRRSRLRRFLGLEEAEELPDLSTPGDAAERAEARRRVHGLLEKISEKKRTVFVLFELEGLSGEEIAHIVGCPLKTVWSRLHHARQEFLEHLEREKLQQARVEAAR